MIKINESLNTPILFENNKILVFHTDQPVLSVIYDSSQKAWFGINRDRQPDSGWNEFRNSRIEEENFCKWTELTPELKKILIEDICEYFTGKLAYLKLKEFNLLK